jgi:hypothetical protein
MEAKIKRMSPEELDELLNGEPDETAPPPPKKVHAPAQGVPRKGGLTDE